MSALHFRWVQASHDFVEEEQLRPGGEGLSQFQSFSFDQAKATCFYRSFLAQSDKLENLERLGFSEA